MCDTFGRAATQAVARDRGGGPDFKLLFQSYKRPQPAPEAVCFEPRHFCRRESVKTDANARWLVSPDVRATYTEDGAVLLDIGKGLCYSLNVVGARMWLTIDASQTGITLDGIVGALETHFNVPRQELETDIAEYLDKLERMARE